MDGVHRAGGLGLVERLGPRAHPPGDAFPQPRRLGDPVRVARHVGGRTRPRPGRRRTHQPGLDRTGARRTAPRPAGASRPSGTTRTALPQGPRWACHRLGPPKPWRRGLPPPALAEVDHPRVAAVGLPHGQAQRLTRRGHDDQMHAWGGIALATPSGWASANRPRLPEEVHRDVVHQVREPKVPIPSRGLTYPVQPTRRLGPVLCPAGGRLFRISLGHQPSLPPVRSRSEHDTRPAAGGGLPDPLFRLRGGVTVPP